MVVSIATSPVTYIPMMTVPNFQIGEKVISELKEICPDNVYTLVSGSNDDKDEVNIQPYTDWDWKFLH
ncbi:hypothetical protein [uncultured phage cr106_1]|uniref:Uncharacterized protein n=1 Tax=uncultured phage cr106_1 TaxID=2772062 RepID=A0A7M1RVD1_9CAUD|nr:hypothetical protein KNV29_gp099 [uncultured phage cr106_1]QOR58288.1 hypothetical protein [uncultured phage cr106_1]